MELNERQQRVLRGEICPYCGKETELVNADKIYNRKGLVEISALIKTIK